MGCPAQIVQLLIYVQRLIYYPSRVRVVGSTHGRPEKFRAPGLDSAPGPLGGARTRQGPLQLMNRATDKSNTDKSGPRQIKY